MHPTLYAQSAAPVVIRGGILALLIVLIIREMIWKGIALWKSGTKRQLVRFIFIFIFNTVGILPIIYLLFFQKKGKK